MRGQIYYTAIEPLIAVKMRRLLGVELNSEWINTAEKIAISIDEYSSYVARQQGSLKPKERREAVVKARAQVEGVIEFLETEEMYFVGLSRAKKEQLKVRLKRLSEGLSKEIDTRKDLRGRPYNFAVRVLALQAAVLLYVLRIGRKVPMHSEHHAFARLMLQAAGVKNPGPGLADVCKDSLVHLKRNGVFGEEKRKILRLFLPEAL